MVKKDLVKHQKVSKLYEDDCLQNFLLIFMFLLIAEFLEKESYLSQNLADLFKSRPTINLKVF